MKWKNGGIRWFWRQLLISWSIENFRELINKSRYLGKIQNLVKEKKQNFRPTFYGKLSGNLIGKYFIIYSKSFGNGWLELCRSYWRNKSMKCWRRVFYFLCFWVVGSFWRSRANYCHCDTFPWYELWTGIYIYLYGLRRYLELAYSNAIYTKVSQKYLWSKMKILRFPLQSFPILLVRGGGGV